MNKIKVNSSTEIPKNFTGIMEFPSGNKRWYKNGKSHREDGPAIEHSDGEKHWCKNGKWHREDGPAIEGANGYKVWFLNEKEFYQIVLENYVILDYSKGEYNLMWYKLLNKDRIFEYPDIPGLIIK